MSTQKFAVKWVYQQVKHHGVPLEAGQKPCLCFKGRKHMVCVAAGYPVRILKRPAADFEAVRQVRNGDGSEYDVKLAVKRFTAIGKKNGITEGAKRILVWALEENAAADLDEEQFENEEELVMTPDETKATNNDATDATDGGKETTVSKKKGGGAKSPAKKKSAVKKTAKKVQPKPAKKASNGAGKGDGLGREGTVTRLICEALIAGKDNDAILKLARAKFPDRKIADNYPQWYRNDLTKKGLLKALKA